MIVRRASTAPTLEVATIFVRMFIYLPKERDVLDAAETGSGRGALVEIRSINVSTDPDRSLSRGIHLRFTNM
jgi:hypothetical protein